jgi:hypothetical protein
VIPERRRRKIAYRHKVNKRLLLPLAARPELDAIGPVCRNSPPRQSITFPACKKNRPSIPELTSQHVNDVMRGLDGIDLIDRCVRHVVPPAERS